MKGSVVVAVMAATIICSTANADTYDIRYEKEVNRRALNSRVAIQNHYDQQQQKRFIQESDAKKRRRLSWGFTLEQQNNKHKYTGW
jgi:uncharacterized protein (DUF697 family)